MGLEKNKGACCNRKGLINADRKRKSPDAEGDRARLGGAKGGAKTELADVQ